MQDPHTQGARAFASMAQVAEGIFDVQAVFNATNEYILYYHR